MNRAVEYMDVHSSSPPRVFSPDEPATLVDVFTGIAAEKRDILNAASLNSFEPDCIHCAFQPYCGSDLIDDISRYGRSDHARTSTWFCKRHTSIFDHVFELMYRGGAAADHSLAQWSGIANWGAHLAPELS